MAKWTKADRSRAWSALRGWLVQHNPGKTVDEVHEEYRVLCAVDDLRMLARLRDRNAEEATRTAEHFRANPAIYGASNPEMIERFETLAKKHRKEAERHRKLADRLEREGMPPKPDGWR